MNSKCTSLSGAMVVIAVLLSLPVSAAETADASVVGLNASCAAQAQCGRGHWQSAFDEVAALAHGAPEAMRMTPQMWQFGPALYDGKSGTNADQVAQWKRRWGCCADTAEAGCQQSMAAP